MQLRNISNKEIDEFERLGIAKGFDIALKEFLKVDIPINPLKERAKYLFATLPTSRSFGFLLARSWLGAASEYLTQHGTPIEFTYSGYLL